MKVKNYVFMLLAAGAIAVLDDINQLTELLP